MPSFLRDAAVLATLTLVTASASVARAGDRETEAPRYQVTPSLAMPGDEPKPAMVDASAETSDAVTAPDRRFYGWQNIAVGYAGIGLMAAGVSKGGALPWMGLGVYALGGPIVHLAHEEYGRAAGSLVINVLTPMLVGAVAHSLDKPCDHNREDGCGLDTIGAAITGVVVGMLAAPIIDGLTMGWEDAPRKPAPAFAIEPTMTIARKEPNGSSTTMLGVAGVF